MYIGKVSKLTGATPKAIRYYEAIGLLAPPKRLGKYRYYSDSDIVRINLIKRAQKYGFKLSELQILIKRIGPDNKIAYEDLIEAIQKKQRLIQNKIFQLANLYDNLTELSDLIQSQKKCPYE